MQVLRGGCLVAGGTQEPVAELLMLRHGNQTAACDWTQTDYHDLPSLSTPQSSSCTGPQGGLLVAVGTHEPAVELLVLRAGAEPRAPATLQPVARLHLAPGPAPLPPPGDLVSKRRRVLLAAALGLDLGDDDTVGGSSGGGGPLRRRRRGGIPESVQLLPCGAEPKIEVDPPRARGWRACRACDHLCTLSLYDCKTLLFLSDSCSVLQRCRGMPSSCRVRQTR